MFIINRLGTLALNFDYALYSQCENDSKEFLAHGLLYKGNHYSLKIYYGSEYEGKIITFFRSDSLDEVKEIHASIMLSHNLGLRVYDLRNTVDQFNNSNFSDDDQSAYWILGQNPSHAVNLKKCSQIKIVNVTERYRREHPASTENFFALIASYDKLCGYKHQTLFVGTSINEVKSALTVLMYSYAEGRKMMDFSGYANEVYERYLSDQDIEEVLEIK